MEDLCRLTKNADHEYECNGCKSIGSMFSKQTEEKWIRRKLHHNFSELNRCVNEGCATCRVFQRALWLRQITKQQADRLAKSSELDAIWTYLPPRNDQRYNKPRGEVLIQIRIGDDDRGRNIAWVSCTKAQRPPPVNLYSKHENPAVTEEVRQWLAKCHDEDHGHTMCKNLGWNDRNPINLVYIGRNPHRLILVDTSRMTRLVRYAALSYSWGTELGKDDKEKRIIKSHTTKEDRKNEKGEIEPGNIHRRRDGFPISDLPATIQDVIKLTKSLGIDYIWIDATCIPPGANWDDEAMRMHEVYGNAYVTLAVCSSDKTTDGFLSSREAWRYKRNVCRLSYSGHWLANIDMPLNEVRLQSPLAERAWTIQEERLSPRIIYVSGQRLYWSCNHSQQTEMGFTHTLERLEGIDSFDWMRHPQKFLASRWESKVPDMHQQWLEVVQAYVKRRLYFTGDRFKAIAGLAVQYVQLFTEDEKVRREEYLAGLWRQTFPQGLSWSVEHPKSPSSNLWSVAPTWSWVSLPLCSDIVTRHKFECLSGEEGFQLLDVQEPQIGKDLSNEPLEVAKRGALVKSVKVRGLKRKLLQEKSNRVPWQQIQTGRRNELVFDKYISKFSHAQNLETGQIATYEPHKQPVVGQLDYLFSEKGLRPWHTLSDVDLRNIYCLQIGKSSMLLLMNDGKTEVKNVNYDTENREWLDTYRRVGICNTVRELFFDSATLTTLVLV